MGIEVLTGFLYSLVVYNIPLLYGTVGEIFNEKAGSLNLGVEGTMAVGSLFGYLVGCWLDSLFLGVLAAMVFAGLCGLLFAFFTVTLQANQNVTGLTITTLGLGIYYFVGHGVNKNLGWPSMQAAANVAQGWEALPIPLLSDIPIIGRAFFSHNLLVYLGVLIAILSWWYMKYTKAGLRMRAVGENPAAADSCGVNINRYKYAHIIFGSAIMGSVVIIWRSISAVNIWQARVGSTVMVGLRWRLSSSPSGIRQEHCLARLFSVFLRR